jgi:hypothetical protein
MAATLTTPNTVLDAVLPKAQTARLLAQIAAVVLGTVALTVAAKIQVPVWPVHITLQSMVVAIIAGALGWRLGVARASDSSSAGCRWHTSSAASPMAARRSVSFRSPSP